MSTQMLEENDSHFVMHDGKSRFRVPKHGLPEHLAAKIRNMKPKKMAEGGLADWIGQPREDADRQDAAAAAIASEKAAQTKPPTPSYLQEYAPLSPVETPPELQKEGVEYGQPAQAAADSAKATVDTTTGPAAIAAKVQQQQAAAIAAKTKPVPVPVPVVKRETPTGEVQTSVLSPTDEAKAAAKEAYDAGVAENDAIAAVHADQARKLEKVAIDQEQLKTRAAEETKADFNQLAQARERYKAIDTNIDQGRWFASRSTPGKIAAAIGLVLGSLGTGPDGINRSAALIQQFIDRDIDAQKTEHEMKLRKGASEIEGAQQLYSQHRQAFQDENTALAATKGTALDIAKAQVDAAAAKASNPKAKAALDALSANLDAKKNDADAAAKQQQFENRIKLGHLANETREANSRLAAAGASGNAANQKQQELVNAVEAEHQTIKEQGTKLKELIKKHGTSGGLTGPGKAEMEQAIQNIATAAAKLKDPSSVARASEVEGEAKTFFKPSFLTSEKTALATIDSYLANAEARRNDAYSIRGLTPPSAQNNEALQWARSHPGDPRAAQILAKLGMR